LLRLLLVGSFVVGYSHQVFGQFDHHHHDGGQEVMSGCGHHHGCHDESDDRDGDVDSGEGEETPDSDQGACCFSCAPAASDLLEAENFEQFSQLVSTTVPKFWSREFILIGAVYHPPR